MEMIHKLVLHLIFQLMMCKFLFLFRWFSNLLIDFFFGFFRLAQSVKFMIAISIFLTYSLQFYVPMEIIWKNLKPRFNEHKNLAEYSLRIVLVVSLYNF